MSGGGGGTVERGGEATLLEPSQVVSIQVYIMLRGGGAGGQ